MATAAPLKESPPAFANPYLQGNYAPVEEETTATALKVTGHIPEELEGRLVRIGPNPLGPVDAATYHWFTGTGMVHGVRLRGGKAEWYRSRYVLGDRAAALLGRPPLPGRRNRPVDGNANTNILDFGGRTCAIVEAGGMPVELTYELESVTRSDFGGTLAHGFTAHPKLDSVSGEMHALTYQPGLQTLGYLVVDKAGKARTVAEIPAPECPMIHDIAITQTSALILDLPVTFDPKTAMSGQGFPFRWRPERTPRVGLLPRDGNLAKLQWIEVPACYVFHVMNAYDAGDTVVMDVVRHERVFDVEHRGPWESEPQLVRWVLHRTTGRFSEMPLHDRGCEFPRFNDAFAARPYRYGYTAATVSPMSGPTYKHDVETRRTEVHDYGTGRIGLEPVFIPRPGARGEDDGWVVTYVYDANRGTSDVVILDAQAFGDAPVATIHLPVRVPFGFHGNWLPDAP